MSEETVLVVDEAIPALATEMAQGLSEGIALPPALEIPQDLVDQGVELPTLEPSVALPAPDPSVALPELQAGFVRKMVGQWYDASIALYQIVARPRTLPMLAQYKIARMRKATEHITEHVDHVKIQLVQELGEPVPNVDPTKWQLKPENKEAFAQRITLVTQLWTDIKIRPLRLSELGTPADNNGIDAREFELLGDLVIDDVSEADDASA